MSTSKSVKGLTIEIGGDTSSLGKELSSVDSEISSLTKSLKTVNNLLEFDTSNTDLLKNKTQLLTVAIEDTEERLEKLKLAQEQFTPEQIEENQTAYVQLQTEILETEAKLADLKNEASDWNKIGTALSNIGDKITSVGTVLTTSLTLPIISLAAYATSTAIEFESAFTGVTKTVEGTDEQLEELKQGIMDLAEECPSTTTEISEVAEAAGQLGIATEDVLDFTKVMIDLGETTNLEATEAAESLAKFANITGLTADEYSNLGSTIVDLGNNFATTEDDIVTMATRMASAGTIAGLTEQEILALATSISSVGIEAEAGGSAMSTTLTTLEKAVANGGESLEQFAEIAGMTSTEFANAWENEPMVALQAFISGLGNLDDESESTALILEDLGLSSIRQSNMLRALALSADDLAEAVDMANTAWSENTALTEEANKRYETTESQLEIAKNKLSNIAITLGSELLPYVNEALSVISDLAEKFANLSDEEQSNIIQAAALVAAIGPVVTIIGKVTSAVGTLTSAIGLVVNGIGTATGSAATLAKGIEALISPTGLAVVALAGLTAGAIALANSLVTDDVKEFKEELNELRNEVDEQTTAWEELQTARNGYLDSSLSEITVIETLAQELQTIVDENGQVKESYEDRAQYILNELNEALGTEYVLNDNLIEQYSELTSSIDTLIATKKAEVVLDAYADEYAEALENQAEAVDTLEELYVKLKEAQDEATTARVEGDTKAYNTAMAQYENLSDEISTQTNLISEYGYTIENYEALTAASVSESAEEINIAVENMMTSYDKATESNETSLAEQITARNEYIQAIKELNQTAIENNDEYQQSIYQTQLESQEAQLESLRESLIEQTNTVGELSEDTKAAWQALADGDLTTYMATLNELPSETQATVSEAVTLINENTSLSNAFSNLASDSTSEYNTSLTISDITQNDIIGAATVIANDTSVENEAENLANDIDTAINDNLDGYTWGTDVVSNMASGMSSKSVVSKITTAASSLASKIKSILGFSEPEEGPLSNFHTYMPDMINLMVKGIDENKSKLTASVENMASDMKKTINADIFDYGEMQNTITEHIIDSTKTVFTTPQITFNVQEMNKENLETCFNYINRKFGSKY